MAADDTSATASYDLPLLEAAASAAGKDRRPPALPAPMLLENILWFCRLRWLVVAMLGVLGVLGLFPDFLARVGLRLSVDWPLVAAGILTLGNLGFSGHARLLRESPRPVQARINLWGQIIFDLLILTAVVHFVGSLGTSMPFAFLFHVVLACIFFSRTESLVVTLMACVLYTSCVVAEHSGLLPPEGLYAAPFLRDRADLMPGVALLNLGLAIAIWLAVWYLTSHLAAMVRTRDERLAQTNLRLEAAMEERSRHLLRTTHELKAPFAAIHAMTQVLLDGQCGPLPAEAAVFVGRISARCRRLANEIQEMVQLANLRSESQGPLPMADLNVAETLRWCIAQVRPLAEERRVTVEADLHSGWTTGVEDHVRMLLGNILGNAVVYSYEGKRVRVACAPGERGEVVVSIADEGIGIPAAKLPQVFDEYYRTNEAVRHNKQSSGLGLAIVRHVAQAHGIRVRVESRPGAGTRFQVSLPPAGRHGGAHAKNKEIGDGLPDDR